MAEWLDMSFKIPYSLCAADILLCSACHYHIKPYVTQWTDEEGRKLGEITLPDYCPNCGAKMEG